MATTVWDAPYIIKMWAPSTTTYDNATYKLRMKSMERGNTKTIARNQTRHRTRAGSTLVYDRGRNFDEVFTMQFRDIQNYDRANLEAFLNAIQWGSTKIKFIDHTGTEFLGRIASTSLKYIDQGFMNRNNPYLESVLWDFDLDFLNLSDSNNDTETAELPATSALSLHLTDINHPHNPKVTVTVNVADGSKVIETQLVDSWDTIIWIVDIVIGTTKKICTFTATHDGTTSADATTVTTAEFLHTDPGGVGAKVTLTADLSGSGTLQVVRLKASSTVDSVVVNVRRVKL